MTLESQKPIKIKFDNPVHVYANTAYTVTAVIRGPHRRNFISQASNLHIICASDAIS